MRALFISGVNIKRHSTVLLTLLLDLLAAPASQAYVECIFCLWTVNTGTP